MTGILQHRRSSTSGVISTTPAAGEMLVNTDWEKPVIGDGATAGGILVDGARRNAQTGTSYAILNADVGKLVTFSNAAPVAVTIAAAASSAGAFWPAQARCWLLNLGAGLVTLTPATSTVNGSATLTLAQGQGASLFSDGVNYLAVKGADPAIGTTLSALADVALSSPANSQRLAYHSATSKWVNQDGVVTVTKTASYPVLAADTGAHFNNVGASGTVIFTLPAAAANLNFGFLVDAAHVVEVLAQSGEKIAIGQDNSAATGNIQASAPYSFVLLEAHKAGQWIASSVVGSWTVN